MGMAGRPVIRAWLADEKSVRPSCIHPILAVIIIGATKHEKSPSDILRGIFVEHRRIGLLTF